MSESPDTLYVAAAIDLAAGSVLLSNFYLDAAELLASFKEKLAETPGVSPGIESRIITFQNNNVGGLTRQIRGRVEELTEDAQMRCTVELAFLDAFNQALKHLNGLREESLRKALQRALAENAETITWVGVALVKVEHTLLVSTFSADKAGLEAEFTKKVKAKFPGAVITLLPAYPSEITLARLRLWLAENEVYGAEMTPLIELFCKGMSLSAEVTAKPYSGKDAGIIPII